MTRMLHKDFQSETWMFYFFLGNSLNFVTSCYYYLKHVTSIMGYILSFMFWGHTCEIKSGSVRWLFAKMVQSDKKSSGAENSMLEYWNRQYNSILQIGNMLNINSRNLYTIFWIPDWLLFQWILVYCHRLNPSESILLFLQDLFFKNKYRSYKWL